MVYIPLNKYSFKVFDTFFPIFFSRYMIRRPKTVYKSRFFFLPKGQILSFTFQSRLTFKKQFEQKFLGRAFKTGFLVFRGHIIIDHLGTYCFCCCCSVLNINWKIIFTRKIITFYTDFFLTREVDLRSFFMMKYKIPTQINFSSQCISAQKIIFFTYILRKQEILAREFFKIVQKKNIPVVCCCILL